MCYHHLSFYSHISTLLHTLSIIIILLIARNTENGGEFHWASSPAPVEHLLSVWRGLPHLCLFISAEPYFNISCLLCTWWHCTWGSSNMGWHPALVAAPPAGQVIREHLWSPSKGSFCCAAALLPLHWNRGFGKVPSSSEQNGSGASQKKTDMLSRWRKRFSEVGCGLPGCLSCLLRHAWWGHSRPECRIQAGMHSELCEPGLPVDAGTGVGLANGERGGVVIEGKQCTWSEGDEELKQEGNSRSVCFLLLSGCGILAVLYDDKVCWKKRIWLLYLGLHFLEKLGWVLSVSP